MSPPNASGYSVDGPVLLPNSTINVPSNKRRKTSPPPSVANGIVTPTTVAAITTTTTTAAAATTATAAAAVKTSSSSSISTISATTSVESPIPIKPRRRGRSLRSSLLLRPHRRFSQTLHPPPPIISYDHDYDPSKDHAASFSTSESGSDISDDSDSPDPVSSSVSDLDLAASLTPREDIDTDTAYYGWVVLCTTWLVCVLGFGSVTGVWQWAWQGEEFSYALWGGGVDERPIEEGDFPIKGYYPAMCILMGVMAWVWVTVAWVGMKYFKHAKIQN